MKNSPTFLSKIIQFGETVFYRAEFKTGADDRRLITASIPVFLIFSLLFYHMIMPRNSNGLLASALDLNESVVRDQVYPVLIEQADEEKAVSDRIRALSDKSVEGRGGMTKNEGFHTISSYDTLSGEKPQPDSSRSSESSRSSVDPKSKKDPPPEKPSDFSTSSDLPDNFETSSNGGRKQDEQISEANEFKIPANYRFRDDFLFRFDERGGLAIPSQEMVGFRYFRDMLRRLRETFSPPGMNYAYRDFAGTVISQPIKSQVVKVLFSIDNNGDVRDVRVVSSMGQDAVDRACIDVLQGKNFGTPPPEIFANGHIFGINFIFPPIDSRR